MHGARGIAVVLGVLTLAVPVAAGAGSLEENLSAYDPATAEGYLKPLQESFGQALNANLFTTAALPGMGFHARLEVKAMSVFFADGDRTFEARTGGDFLPVETAEASTVVGPEQSTVVDGQGGTQYVFPGGFDLTSLTLAVPQLTLSGLGSEVMVRWIGADVDEADVGHIVLWGFGIRHSISQYMVGLPVQLAASIHYHRFNVESDLLDVESLNLGVQGSKSFGLLTAYGGLAYQASKLTAEWTSEAGTSETAVSLSSASERAAHLVAGATLTLGVLQVNACADLAERLGVSAGIGIGY